MNEAAEARSPGAEKVFSLCLCASAAAFFFGCGIYSPLDSHYNRGVEYYDQGRIADAIREYRLAIAEGRENYKVHFNLAVCYHDQGKLDEAALQYEDVLQRVPGNARAMVNLASIRGSQGKDEEALALLARAAEADRDSGFPRSAMGAYYERKGDLDPALRAYRESVAVEPGHSAGHAGIARILARRGENAAALEELERALGAEPDDVALLLASSEAREKKGDLKGATLHLERVLVHVKHRAPLWIRLADLYTAQGRLEDAVAALWQARGAEATNSEVSPRLKALYGKLAESER